MSIKSTPTSIDTILLGLDRIKAAFPTNLKDKPNFKLFHINKIRDFNHSINLNQPPYRKSVTDFIVITKGNTKRTKGLNSYELGTNSIFFVPANQIRTVSAISEDLDGYFCHFDSTIFNPKVFPKELLKQFSFLQYIGNPEVDIPQDKMKDILWIMYKLEEQYGVQPKPDYNLISALLITLFYTLNQFIASNPSKISKAAVLTQRYKDALMEHIYDMQTVSEYANYLHVSRVHLNRSVKEILGVTALSLLTDMLLLESKYLLRQTDLDISEIAFRLGNKNHSDFSRFFKKHTGLTPNSFRKN